MAPESSNATDRLRGDIQWADNYLGRAGGLTAAGVFAAAGKTTQMVGFAIGDPKLHLKAGLRGLIPLHLRVSARVHHISFLHPSLDTEFAHLAGGRGSSGDAVAVATPKKRASVSKSDKKGYGKNLDMSCLSGSEYATGGESGGFKGKGKGKAGGSGANALEALVLNEKGRLSRDGIVRDEADRKRRAARRGSRGEKIQQPDTVPEIKGKRKFVMLSSDEISDGKTGKQVPSPRAAVQRAVMGSGKSKNKNPKSTIRRGDSFGEAKKKGVSRRLANPPADVDVNQRVVFDAEGITGDGPLLASVIMDSPAAKIGRYLPETACRVPDCAVSFELTNDARRVKSTQPFVPEAPHVIWGGARDAPLKMVADDGNALVEARALEYLTDSELDMAERTESLLVTGSTVWVDIPPEVKKDAKTSKDYAMQMNKAAVKGGKQMKKGLAKGAAATADATKQGANAIGKAAADAKQAGKRGAAHGHENIFPLAKTPKNIDPKHKSAEKRGEAMAKKDNADGESVEDDEESSLDETDVHDEVSAAGESLEQTDVHCHGTEAKESLDQAGIHDEGSVAGESVEHVDIQNEGSAAGESLADNWSLAPESLERASIGQSGAHRVKKTKKLKKMMKKTAKAMHLTKKKEKATSDSESAQTRDVTTSQLTLNTSVEQSFTSVKSAAKDPPRDPATLLPKKKPHYTLVLDDVLRLKVTSFPFGDRFATFPVSVAAILNATSMDDRVADPQQPSELTVTLVQEPSITEGHWGVEVRVTFRVVEVRPDSPLSEEDNPALDEKSGKWHKVKFSDKMKNFKIRLKNTGKSNAEVEAEITAAEEREEELAKAKEAAIVAAGIGRGYHHGAAMQDIVKHQMFYDPERIAHRQVRRRTSNEVDVEIIKAMAIHGHGFDSVRLGRQGAELSSAMNPLPDSMVSKVQRDHMKVISPLSAAKEEKPFEFVSRADGLNVCGPGVSALSNNARAGPKNDDVTDSELISGVNLFDTPAAETFSSVRPVGESDLENSEGMSGWPGLSDTEADQGSLDSAVNLLINAASDTVVSSGNKRLVEGSDSSQPSGSAKSKAREQSFLTACDQPSSLPPTQDSLSGQLVATSKKGDHGGLARSVDTEGEDEQVFHSTRTTSSGAGSASKSRREMMRESHRAHAVGSEHKVDSLHLVEEESKVEIVHGSVADTSKIEVTASKSMGSGHFGVDTSELNRASHSEAGMLTMSKSMVDTKAPLGDIHERSESFENSTDSIDPRTSAKLSVVASSTMAGSDTNSSTSGDDDDDDDDARALAALEAEAKSCAREADEALARAKAAMEEANAEVAVRTDAIAGTIAKAERDDVVDAKSEDGSKQHSTSSERSCDDSQPSKTKGSERYKMMSRFQDPSGGKLSLTRSIAKMETPESVRTPINDFDSFLRQQRREKLQAIYQKEQEARLASAARSMKSTSPPISSIFLRMSEIRRSSVGMDTASGISAFSVRSLESEDQSNEKGFWWCYSYWVKPFGEALKGVLFEEYPGLLVLITLVGAILLLR